MYSIFSIKWGALRSYDLSFPTTWKLLLLVQILFFMVVIIVFGFCFFLLLISLLWLILIIAMFDVWWNLWKPWMATTTKSPSMMSNKE